ncbi:MAG: RNA polymerase Rpb4 [Nitrososphaerales archaeon]
MADILKKTVISLPEVKEILDKANVEDMDQIQRWTHDYVTKFVDIEPKQAKKMKEKLIQECSLTETEAVEIVNIMPTSIEELRAFTFGWKKLILTDTLEKMLKIIKENA